ncbi:hypothetical protein TNCV_4524851 [Trichonephila clavipes]|nr:hypothetical protein TNCV_4524851 [Trichonephila clavipes]
MSITECLTHNGTYLLIRILKLRAELMGLHKLNLKDLIKWAEQFCWNGDRLSLSTGGTAAPLSCDLIGRSHHSQKSGRGNGLGRSENKRPETRRS